VHEVSFHPQTLGLIIQNSVDMVTWHLRLLHSWAKLLYKWNMLPSFKSVRAETEQTLGWYITSAKIYVW